MLEPLRRIVAGFMRDPGLQADLMQECLVHLWTVKRQKPGRTLSWYLQSCRFHIQHWLASGRSLDSFKRLNGNNRIIIDTMGDNPALAEYHTNGELFEQICFQDMVSTLAPRLQAPERAVLERLADGLKVAEIASESGLSYPTVLKYRRKIASLVCKLGISQMCADTGSGNCQPARARNGLVPKKGTAEGRPEPLAPSQRKRGRQAPELQVRARRQGTSLHLTIWRFQD
jgi:DNA-directed RNA polymerase specialized sigma24 family protein